VPSGSTPNIGLTIPTVGGDSNIWGVELNGNLTIIDRLGVGNIWNVSSNFSVSYNTSTEQFYRITTGGLTVTGTLPDPALIPLGKLFTFKMLDIGVVNLQCVNPGVFIDGAAIWSLFNQYNFVRLLAVGSTYDVVATG
jgi:hypothetical protein